MLTRILDLLFEPRYPTRYIGRHRAPHPVPTIALALRRPRSVSA